MNILNKMVVLAMSLAAPTVSAGEWETDLQAACEKAKEAKKDVLVEFTGSDWGGFCEKLEKEVCSSPAFREGIRKKFVWVKLDFPRNAAQQNKESMAKNRQLKEHYGVKTMPRLILLDAIGRPYAETGYRRGGVEKFMKHLLTLHTRGVELNQSLSDSKKLKGLEKAKALTSALSELPDQYLRYYSAITDEIARLDPDDVSGFRVKKEFSKALTALEGDIIRMMNSRDIAATPRLVDAFIEKHQLVDDRKRQLLKKKLQVQVEVNKRMGSHQLSPALVDKFLTEHRVEGQERQELLGMKITPLLHSRKYDEAIKILDSIIDIDSESELGDEQRRPNQGSRK